MIIHTKTFIQTKQCQASHVLLSQGDRELRSDIRYFVQNKTRSKGSVNLPQDFVGLTLIFKDF